MKLTYLLLSISVSVISALPNRRGHRAESAAWAREVENVEKQIGEVAALSRSLRSIDPAEGNPRTARYLNQEDDNSLYRPSRSPQDGYGAPQAEYSGGGSGRAGNQGGGGGGGLMPYRFGYAVKDEEGNDFNQQEQSDGNQITGQYSVLLPDGRIQTVTYSVAPDTGFVAEVSYSGGGGGGGGGGGFGGGLGGAQAAYGAPGRK